MIRLRQKEASLLRFLPFIVLFGIVMLYVYFSKNISAQDIVQYTPENLYFAAVVMIGLYAFKSVTLVFPLTILYLAAGIIFPTAAAILVSCIGLLVSLSIPYAFGYLLGEKTVGKLLTKYEKTNELKSFRTNNKCLFAYILRAIKMIPVDLVSLLLGAEKMPFDKYLLGSSAGLLPTLLSTIVLGSSASDPDSVTFILSAVFTVLFTLLPLCAYPVIMRKRAKKETQNSTEISTEE